MVGTSCAPTNRESFVGEVGVVDLGADDLDGGGFQKWIWVMR
ncbi:hypothetical protein [Streptomyces zhaozhouensis]